MEYLGVLHGTGGRAFSAAPQNENRSRGKSEGRRAGDGRVHGADPEKNPRE